MTQTKKPETLVTNISDYIFILGPPSLEMNAIERILRSRTDRVFLNNQCTKILNDISNGAITQRPVLLFDINPPVSALVFRPNTSRHNFLNSKEDPFGIFLGMYSILYQVLTFLNIPETTWSQQLFEIAAYGSGGVQTLLERDIPRDTIAAMCAADRVLRGVDYSTEAAAERALSRAIFNKSAVMVEYPGAADHRSILDRLAIQDPRPDTVVILSPGEATVYSPRETQQQIINELIANKIIPDQLETPIYQWAPFAYPKCPLQALRFIEQLPIQLVRDFICAA